MLTVSAVTRPVARSRTTRRALAIALPVAILLLVGAALTPSRAARQPSRFGVAKLARHTSTTNTLGVHITKVYGSNVPAQVYGTEIADLEDQGENTRGEMISELSPLPARAFVTPVAAYKAYAERWTVTAERYASDLQRALVTGTRTSARSAWE